MSVLLTSSSNTCAEFAKGKPIAVEDILRYIFASEWRDVSIELRMPAFVVPGRPK